MFHHKIDSHDDESVIGYVGRRGDLIYHEKKQYYDEKEYFHYNRYVADAFGALMDEDDRRIKNFLDSAEKIYLEAERHASEFLESAELHFPGVYEKFFPKNKDPHFYLRFLKYNTMGKGEFLAKGHYDQGAFTFALAESAPGLRIGSHDSDLCEVEHRDGQLIFMPALQLQDFLSPDFSPAWHDVVQSSDNTYSADAARWAIVFFADPVVKSKSSWEDRHTVTY